MRLFSLRSRKKKQDKKNGESLSTAPASPDSEIEYEQRNPSVEKNTTINQVKSQSSFCFLPSSDSESESAAKIKPRLSLRSSRSSSLAGDVEAREAAEPNKNSETWKVGQGICLDETKKINISEDEGGKFGESGQAGKLKLPVAVREPDDVQIDLSDNEQEEFKSDDEAEVKIRAIHEDGCRKLRRGEFGKALPKFEEILAILLRRFGEEHYRVGAALHNVGIVNLRAGNIDDAMDAMEDAVRIRKTTLGEDSSKVTDSLVELGIILLCRTEYGDALEIFNEALEMREREELQLSAGADTKKIQLSIAKILNNIGCVYFEYGDIIDAKQTFDEALELQRLILDNADPYAEPGFLAMASTMCNMGYVHLEQEEFADATSILEEALCIQQEFLEEGCKLVQDTLDNIGFANALDRNYDAALKIYEELLEHQKESFGECNIVCAETHQKIVYVHLRLFQYEQALQHLHVVEYIQEEEFGTDSQQLKNTRDLIGSVNYQLLKFPNPKEVVVKSMATNGFRNPFTKKLCDCACFGGEVEDVDLELHSYSLKRPYNRSKMSGHKVAYA